MTVNKFLILLVILYILCTILVKLMIYQWTHPVQLAINGPRSIGALAVLVWMAIMFIISWIILWFTDKED